jgi:hypothetical protein
MEEAILWISNIILRFGFDWLKDRRRSQQEEQIRRCERRIEKLEKRIKEREERAKLGNYMKKLDGKKNGRFKGKRKV